MAFYRHFIERQDFEIQVATNCQNFPKNSVAYTPLFFDNSRVTRRLCRTRLLPWFYGLHSLIAFGRVPSSVWRVASQFKPDAIFTIAGSWDWSALVAERVAHKIGVPLIASFNDWFNYGWFPPHPVFHPMIEKRFRRFYRDADLALCTCEGMREALGEHPNTHILYPIGAPMKIGGPIAPFVNNGRQYIVAFAGSLADWYGPMLERLVRTAESRQAQVEFRIFGSNATWSKEFDAYARNSNIYRGHLTFETLRQEMANVDALMLPMGFEDRAVIVERTSFKTKFLDYLAYRKPILVWGPEYCSAVRAAREFDSAEICTNSDAESVLKSILLLAENPDRQMTLVANSKRMYEGRFHPDKIHTGFVKAINQAIENNRGKRFRSKGQKEVRDQQTGKWL